MVAMLIVLMMFQPHYGQYTPSDARLNLAIGTSCDAWRSLWQPALEGKISGLRPKIEYLRPLIDDLRPWTEQNVDQILSKIQVQDSQNVQWILFQWVAADTLASLSVARARVESNPVAARGWMQIAQCNWNLVRPWLEERKKLMASVIDTRLNEMLQLIQSANQDNLNRFDEFARRIALDLADFINSQGPELEKVYLAAETDQKKISFEGSCKIVLPEPVRALNVSGMVIYRVTVSPEGKPLEIEILRSPHPAVGDAVSNALERCRFTRPTKDGKPVKALVTGSVMIKP